MPVQRVFSPRFNQAKRRAIELLSETLRPYTNTSGLRHRIVTSLYMRLLRETEYADPELVRELQRIRLKKIMRIAERSPFWKQRMREFGIDYRTIRSLQELEKLPPVDKRLLRNIPTQQLVAKHPGNKRFLMRRTSGTTGIPFEWGLDRNMLLVEATANFYRLLQWNSVLPKKRSRPFIARFVPQSYVEPAMQFDWNPASPDSHQNFMQSVEQIRSAHLTIFNSYPTHAILFAKKAAELDRKPSFSVAICSGQEFDGLHRMYVSEKLGCPTVLMYGCIELELMAIECPARHNRYHLNAERVILEIVDDMGRNVSPGTDGLITFTTLVNRAMPLFRYQTGDRGRLILDPCPCGRTLLQFELVGRRADFIVLANGKQMLFQNINMIMLRDFFEEIELYQIEQVALDRLVVRCKLKQNTEVFSFEERLAKKLRASFGKEVSFSFEYPSDWGSPSSKIKTLIPLDTTKGDAKSASLNL